VAIDVGCCHQTSDDAFSNKKGTRIQSELRVLKISSCVRLIVAGVSRVIEYFKALEYLDVLSCP
jgi:F-box/leucine-rich repeat protein 2/20